MAKKAQKKSSNSKVLLGTAVASAAAAAVGYYFYGPKGKKHRDELRSWTLKAQGEVMERLEKLKQIDKDAYNKVVDDVTKKYAKAKGVAAKELAGFARDVKEQWEHVEKEFEKGAKKGRTAVKKSAKKAKKTAKKAVTKAKKVSKKA